MSARTRVGCVPPGFGFCARAGTMQRVTLMPANGVCVTSDR